MKLVASELGGPDYVSLNLYRLEGGDLLKPCEMEEAKVRAFVTGLTPDAAFTKDRSGDTFGTTKEG